MDGCCYHPNIEDFFGQVSSRMTDFISLKLGIEKEKQKNSTRIFLYRILLNGLMKII